MDAALVRLNTALGAWDHPEIPLFETLNWLVSLQDLLKASGCGHPDFALVDSTAFAFSGLRWVRNIVHHEWLRAIELVPTFEGDAGLAPPKTFPGHTANLKAGAWSYRWVSADQLDPITPKRRQVLENPNSVKHAENQHRAWNQRQNYEHYVRLAGVQESLRSALSFASAFLARLDR